MSQQLQLTLPALTIALFQQELGNWLAICSELGLECEGETEQEARDALSEAISDFLSHTSQDELDKRLAANSLPEIQPAKLKNVSRPAKIKKRIGQLAIVPVKAGKAVGGVVVNSGSALVHKAGDARVVIGGAIVKVGEVGSNAVHHAYPAFETFTGKAGEVAELLADNRALRQVAKKFKLEKWLDLSSRVDIEKAQQHVRKLKQKYPDETPRQISQRITKEKATYAGGLGLLTSFIPGSALSLLAVDLAGTSLIQAELVYQIAAAYNLDLKDPARKGELLAVFGVVLGTGRAVKAGLTVLKNVPLAGAVVGASSNTVMIYALGNAASKFYEEKLHLNVSQKAIDLVKAENETFLRDATAQETLVDQVLVHILVASQPTATHQEIIDAIKKANLSPASIEAISKNLANPQDLDSLLTQIHPDFAAYLLQRCQYIAQMDGATTEQEKQILEKIATHFQLDSKHND
ncbi:hypothetical protein EON83_29385 [bacterium]|nr:MAG: hypothetical protein EON83_29385 [bacterium]